MPLNDFDVKHNQSIKSVKVEWYAKKSIIKVNIKTETNTLTLVDTLISIKKLSKLILGIKIIFQQVLASFNLLQKKLLSEAVDWLSQS
jgi:hypothetical protein